MLQLALLWHQHQPVYKDTAHPVQAGSYRQPWERLHAIRGYYSMAALVAGHPDLHLTINLTPVLLWQIEDYARHGATDRQMELTLKPAEALESEEREEVLSSFFDAHWHNQIFPHARYKALFAQRQAGEPFDGGDLRDLQMWFNLAWFGREFREDDITLVTGETVQVRRFVEQRAGFSVGDVQDMLVEQGKLLRAVIPIHRHLQDRGQIEVATTPYAQWVQTVDRLMIRTNCPGVLRWGNDRGQSQEAELSPVGGVLAGVLRFQITLGPFTAGEREIRFRFVCQHPGCDGQDICCSPAGHVVQIRRNHALSKT